MARLPPDGVGTRGQLVLAAQDGDGVRVGSLWIALDGPDHNGDAWIYEIVIDPERRGQGLGRALLAAAEREVARHDVQSLALNVFGTNTTARRLYESAGYETTTLQMRKAVSQSSAD